MSRRVIGGGITNGPGRPLRGYDVFMKTRVGGRSQSCDNQVNDHQVNSKGKGPEAATSIGYWKNRGANHGTEQRRE